MNVWAIADLHLSFSVHKDMTIFGEDWINHTQRIAIFWDSHVKEQDLVLIPGDISWAMKQDDAKLDLEWIHKRPGTKVLIRGNHDYWWTSAQKVRALLPSSLHIISNDVYIFHDIAIAGARLWDTNEYNFNSYIEWRPNPKERKDHNVNSIVDDEKKYEQELHRLEISLKLLPQDCRHKIAITHYPPIGANLEPTRASKLFEQYGVQHVFFGHLHSLKSNQTLFGTKNGITYYLVSCDWLKCTLQHLVLY